MRFTITPLGSVGGRTVDQVVGDIVRYLNRPRPVPQPATRVARAEPGASRYYSDGADEPGRWLGEGAAAAELCGDVDPDFFAKVLAGRDPRSGVRLLTARGSAGRRPTLGVGAETRWADDGELLYDEADAARALGIEDDELERLFSVGMRVAHDALTPRTSGARHRVREPAGAYLTPLVDRNGNRWVRDSELSRLQRARAAGPSREEVESTGDPDDLLPLADAARLAGVTGRYLRGLAGHWEKHRTEIERALTDGRPVKRAHIVACRGAEGRWLVRRSDLAAFVARRTTPAVRVGFDLTLTTEKSLGVLALLGDDGARTAVLDAITAGNDTGLAWWEQRMAARVGGELVPVRGWTAASFRHLTSRALDPFPHHHNVVANSVEVAGGERRTLDSRTLYRHAVGASALATAEMRHQLTGRLGVTWRRSPSGGWEIDGIPREVLREFSQRRNEIDEALAELEEAIGRTSTIEELRHLVTQTRPPKRQADANDLRSDWWRRARSHGFTPADLAMCIHRAAPVEQSDVAILLDRLAGPDGLSAGGSVFTRGDVLAGLADAPVGTKGREQPLTVGAARLEEIADEFLASDRVVRLQPVEGSTRLRGLGDERIYATREMLAVQQRIVDRHRRGLRGGGAAAGSDAIAQVVATGGLSTEQATLVRAFCGSGQRVQCAIGRAGTGKTTAMRAAAEAWQRAGYRVAGAAVKGEAARQLGQAAGIPAETLAWYLAWDDPARGPLDARTVLVVDEASTIGDRDLDRLLQLAESTGATVRLIGDPAQHGAVAAGGMFRVLCERHPGLTPELTENRRLLHAGDRDAVDALRDGRIEEALAALRGAGHLHLATDDVQLYARLLTRWWDSRQAGAPHPLVERSNRRRRQLNRLARKLLQVHGEVGTDELQASGERAFSVGDEVIARRGNRQLYPEGDPKSYLRNGSRGTVAGIVRDKVSNAKADQLIVTFVGIGTISVPRAFFDDHPGPNGRTDAGIDHAYAVTSYAVQGATFEESTGRVDDRTSRAETYVNLTRGRLANHLFVTRAEDPLDGERLPKAPAPPLEAALSIRLRASGAEVTAWELDPDALARGAAPERRLPDRSADRARRPARRRT